MDNEQEPAMKKPQKAPKTSEYSDNEQVPAPKYIVMYSTEDEQEPVIKQPQKVSKIPKFVDTDTEDEQETTIKQPQKTSPAKTPNFAAAGCTYILTKSVRKGKQCRFRA